MRVVVHGDFREPVLLDTDKATSLLIYSNDDTPNTIFRMIANGKGWMRYTKEEDPSFDEVARALGLIK
jgi:hypothetical protein